MSLSRDSRAERIWKAVRRTQFALKQRIDRINWEEDELLPEIAAIKAGKATGELPAGSAIEIVVEHANPRPNDPGDSGTPA